MVIRNVHDHYEDYERISNLGSLPEGVSSHRNTGKRRLSYGLNCSAAENMSMSTIFL